MRKKLTLDYAKRVSLERRLGQVALVAVGLTAAVLLLTYFNRAAERERLEAKWRAVQAKRAVPSSAKASAESLSRLKTKIEVATRAAERLGLPWEAFFSGLEATLTDNVALLGVEPDLPGGSLRITAEAKDFSAMLDYVRRLADQPLFFEPYIVAHEIQATDPQRPVRFTVAFQGARGGGKARGEGAPK